MTMMVKQKDSLVAYVIGFRNVKIKILDMTDGEKIDSFSELLKYHIRFEVIKSRTENLKVAIKIAIEL